MASSRHLPVALLTFAVTLLVASFAEGQVFLSKLPNTTFVVTATLPSGGPFTGLDFLPFITRHPLNCVQCSRRHYDCYGGKQSAEQ